MNKAFIISFALILFATKVTAQDATEKNKPRALSIDAEAGIVSSNGNTKSQSYLLKNVTSYKFVDYLAKLSGAYLSNESRDNVTNVTTSYEQWNIGLRLERELTDRFSLFLGQSVESDKKAGIDRRFNSDVGAKYYIAIKQGYYTFGELGYRYTTEEYANGALPDENYNYIRSYIESEKKWTPTLSSKFWVEYLPNLDDSKDYTVNTEISASAAIDNTFSIKSAYLVKYDNIPAAIHKTDTLFLTTLIAKF